MKIKPQLKKLAALLELDKQELKYLLFSLDKMPYHTEELHEKIKMKLDIALNSFA